MDELVEREDVEKCECCGYPVEGDPFKMCVSAKELIDLGIGFPLYFQFIKYVFILFYFGFVPFGIVMITIRTPVNGLQILKDFSCSPFMDYVKLKKWHTTLKGKK